MVNNFSYIGRLIEKFQVEGVVFDLLIIQRKKDNAEHKSGKIIYRKLISSKDSLLDKEFLIQALCEHYKARAYINLSPKSKEDITKNLCTKAVNDIAFTHNYEPERLLGSAIGDTKGHNTFKLWVVDIDFTDNNKIQEIKDKINSCRPSGTKIWATVPTKHGVHLITSPFDLQEFSKAGLDAGVKKDNPTLLYYPDSLECTL